MKINLIKNSVKMATLIAITGLVGCGGGGGGGSSWGAYVSSSVTADRFVDALNDVDGAYFDLSDVTLYEDETYRSFDSGEDEWFVIWDAKWDEYKAVSLQYIRSIVYYDYFSNDDSLADEFREIENDDIFLGDVNGDNWGDDYEVVDYDSYTDSYWGRNSGFEYEDESESLDVNLMAAELAQRKFLAKAAKVSFAFNINIQTSLSLVTLGTKVEHLLQKGEGEITAMDQLALTNDIQKLTGASLSDMMKAGVDGAAKAQLIAEIAAKIGTTTANLESKILPELLGINL